MALGREGSSAHAKDRSPLSVRDLGCFSEGPDPRIARIPRAHLDPDALESRLKGSVAGFTSYALSVSTARRFAGVVGGLQMDVRWTRTRRK